MPRLIDADALSEALVIVAKKMAKSEAQKALMGRVLYILDNRHEEVVRCRECKHKNMKKCPMVIVNFNSDMEEMLVQNHVSDDFFCPYGERKDGAE